MTCLGLILAWRWRRGRRKKKRADPIVPTDAPFELDPSPRERLIASSESVRDALIGTFGPGWASKTTEEISAYPGLAKRLKPDEVDRLVAFLRLADRAKFADDEPETLEDWEGWAGGFASILAAGAGSGINGK